MIVSTHVKLLTLIGFFVYLTVFVGSSLKAQSSGSGLEIHLMIDCSKSV